MRRLSIVARCFRLVLIVLALVWSAFPIVLVVLSSFKEASQIFDVPPRLTFTPTLDNYRTLWNARPEFFRALLNSFVITLGTLGLTLVATTLSGYVYARYRSRFLSASAFGLLAVRMLPPIIVTVPLFPVLNVFRVNDTHVLLILLYAAFYVSLGTWIMRSFIAALPIALEEAAEVDGASVLQILTRVVLPLVVPGLIAVAIFVVVFAWNEYVFALIFTTRHAKTAPVIIGEMLGTVEGVQWGVIFAAATVQLLPVLALVIALQRYLVAGLTTGAVK
ncbi:MAG TPA: carbohydrate ABC transporter permease [Casimicrobiaceae bacterium]|nr:carbohydrate ABC transporter permease [Casimicrobiaceae bacterium]